jgi:hypothetical protein
MNKFRFLTLLSLLETTVSKSIYTAFLKSTLPAYAIAYKFYSAFSTDHKPQLSVRNIFDVNSRCDAFSV